MMNFDHLDQSEIKHISAGLWDNIFAAGNAKNYDLFSKDFSTEMLEVATKEMIEQQWQREPLLLKLVPEPEYLGFLKNSRGIRVLWKQKMQGTEDEALGHLELVYENGEIRVDGAQVL